MPRMITGSDLSTAVEKSTFIQGGDVKCAEGVKYDFRLSNRILKATFGRPVDASQLSETERSNLFVEPGEMVFVLSAERLTLPETMTAELSPKRKLSHAGILAMGGFCIDPLYRGFLLIGLYNFSSTRFPLIPGKKLIAATFYELSEGELGQFQTPDELDDFPDELIQVMSRYQPLAIQSVQDAVQKLTEELRGLKADFQSRTDWYQRFERSLDRHDEQISELLRGLNAEVQARNSGEDKLSTALSEIKTTLSWLRGAVWAFGIVLAFVGLPLALPPIIAWLKSRF